MGNVPAHPVASRIQEADPLSDPSLKPAPSAATPAIKRPTDRDAQRKTEASIVAVKSPQSGLRNHVAASALSMGVHIIVLLAMALVVSDPPKEEKPRFIVSTAPEVAEEFEEFEVEVPLNQPEAAQDVSDAVVMPDSNVDVQVVSNATDLDAAPLSVELTDFSSETATSSDLLSSVGAIGGKATGIGGRSNPKVRQQLVSTGGGTPQSEAAVEAALKWFINHQLPDGSWSFDLTRCPTCNGQCTHSGIMKGVTAGPTALAILPFLGRGYTQLEGPYKKQLEYGLNALATKVVAGKGNAGEGCYVQGLTGICLSEAYAMTQDNRLQLPAQLAINYVMASQDPAGGGWGYSFRAPGDTSIFGWNLVALKSGHLAYLAVDPLSVKRAVGFLESVQSDEGSGYGYRGPGNSPALSAVGLLSRRYLGWKKDHPALERGLDRLAKAGPNANLYYDYYATQVLHHVEGERWTAWNNKMRDSLIKAQSTTGHEAGSWYEGFGEQSHGAHGGRIYCTSLATMILEVYYRHMPIYSQQSVDEDFKE